MTNPNSGTTLSGERCDLDDRKWTRAIIMAMRLKALRYSVSFFLVIAGSLHAQVDLKPTVPEAVGVDIHFFAPRPGEMKLLAGTGVRWVRMDFYWALTETEKGKYDFTRYDGLVSALQSANLRAVFVLDYGNPLYTKEKDQRQPPRSPEAQNAFAEWAAAAVSRFRGKGIVWEIWNEPNAAVFWLPRANVQEYISLATKVGEAVKQKAPGETYIGPATGWVDMDFLQACLRGGLLKYWSAVSVHPYRKIGPESAARDFETMRSAIAQEARGKQIPVVVSEWGYPFPGDTSMDPEAQAKVLPRVWLTNLSNGIPLSIWYDWVNPQTSEPQSIVTLSYDSAKQAVFQPKPAFYAAQTLTSFFNGYRFSKRLPAGGPNDYVLVFSNGGQERIAAWTVSPTPHSIVIPVSSGSFGVTNNVGQAERALTASARGLTITVSDSPQYLLPGGGSFSLPAVALPANPVTPAARLAPQQAEALNLAWRNLARAYQDIVPMGPDPSGATAKLKAAVDAAIHDLHTLDPALGEASGLQGQDAAQPRAQALNAIQQHLDLARKYITDSKLGGTSVEDALSQIALCSKYVEAARQR